MTATGANPTIDGAPRERGWRWLVLALVVAVAISLVARWPASLALPAVAIRLLIPIQPFGLLVLMALLGCTVASWARGGAFASALLAVVLLGVVLRRESGNPTTLHAFSIGWSVLLAAAFGWVNLVHVRRGFLSRALSAIMLAGGITVLVLSFTGAGIANGVRQIGSVFEQELDRRRGEALSQWETRRAEPSWTALGVRAPSVVRSADAVAQWMATVPTPVSAVPALILFESLGALAMAWALWHRLARTRLGPPLSQVSQFRFNDQLVWGLLVGITLVLVPSVREWRGLGVNLLLVFGALYALRGVGVLVWFIPDRWAWLPLVLLLVCIPLLGPVQVLATVAVLALGLGLGDTWRDFRRSAQPLRPNVRP